MQTNLQRRHCAGDDLGNKKVVGTWWEGVEHPKTTQILHKKFKSKKKSPVKTPLDSRGK